MSHALKILTPEPLSLATLIDGIAAEWPDLDHSRIDRLDQPFGYVYPSENATRGIYVEYGAFDPTDEDPDEMRLPPAVRSWRSLSLTYHAMCSEDDLGFAVDLCREAILQHGAHVLHEGEAWGMDQLTPEWVQATVARQAGMLRQILKLPNHDAVTVFGRRRDFYLGPWLAQVIEDTLRTSPARLAPPTTR